MERSRTDGGEKAALLMGADAAEADDGPALAATAAKSDESSPSVASGNAFARFASAMLTRMNSITSSSGANSREASPAKEGRAAKHDITAADFDSAAFAAAGGDDTPIMIRSAKSKSPSLSPRFRRKQHRSSPQPSPSSRSRTPSPRSVTSDNSATSPSGAPGINAATTTGDGSACNTLTVPGFLGAIPRPQPPRRRRYQHASSTESDSASANTELSTPSGSTAAAAGASGGAEERRCFCGYYSEQKDAAAAAAAVATSSSSSGGGGGGKKKPGRCKFCRSKAKYVPGQRSFDASRFFRGGGGGGAVGAEDGRRGQPRRAASEDRRSDGMTTEDTSASTSAATTAQSSFDRGPSMSMGGFFSTPPFLRRQERLEFDPPSPNLLTVPSPIGGGSPTSSIGGGGGLFYTRDHGLRTPPAPPCTVLPQTTIETIPSVDEFQDIESDYRLTHRMAHEMPEYLVPPPRAAILVRAHTDPDTYDPGSSSSSRTAPPMAPPPSPNFRPIPSSPPPAYTDVVGESLQCHRSAPPTYEEALNSRLADQHRIPTSSRAPRPHLHHHHGGHLAASVAGNVRSLSEERTLPTAGTAASTSSGGLRGRRAAYMVRSSRAEEIPDIYWEQAARELDFCTCRKCQARYRQYFEEDPAMASVVSGDATGIPMETQYLMQEVLTDGMAFCSLM